MTRTNLSALDDHREHDTLTALVDTLDTLERRLYSGESYSDRLISPESLDQILRSAGTRFLASVKASESSNAQRLDLSAEVKRVIGAKAEAIQSGDLLSLRHTALLQIVESFFRYLEYAEDLEPGAYSQIQYLQIGFARILVADPGALTRPDHPARQFFELLIDNGKAYDPHSGPRADILMVNIGKTVRTAVDAPGRRTMPTNRHAVNSLPWSTSTARKPWSMRENWSSRKGESF